VCAHELLYSSNKDSDSADEKENNRGGMMPMCPKTVSVAVANTEVSVEQHIMDTPAIAVPVTHLTEENSRDSDAAQ
jgi:hypothetical protein